MRISLTALSSFRGPFLNMHWLFPIVKDLVTQLLAAARADPYALEAMWMCFVAVGSALNVVKRLCPLDEVRGVNIKPSNEIADVSAFETEMIKLFENDLILKSTATQKSDHFPRVLWLSDGSRPEFVRSCSTSSYWKEKSSFAYFLELDCTAEVETHEVHQILRWTSLVSEREWAGPSEPF